MLITDKIILDSCCGSRMLWFDKENPLVFFADIRDEEHELCDGRLLKINPHAIMDFTDLPFTDRQFKMVVFDPPHLYKIGDKAWMALKYGKLLPGWEDVIKQGLNECMRVVDDYGTVIFKWNEHQIPVSRILSIIDHKPLFGHTTSKGNKTIWMCFMKIPK